MMGYSPLAMALNGVKYLILKENVYRESLTNVSTWPETRGSVFKACICKSLTIR
jgi:hypothetical protein